MQQRREGEKWRRQLAGREESSSRGGLRPRELPLRCPARGMPLRRVICLVC